MSTEMPHSDESVQKSTGKNWAEWKSMLDDWGAAGKPHNEIAAYLVNDHGVEDWWAQGVTVGYE